MTDLMTDPNDPRRRMFGDYRLKPNSGVNPPYSPAYPVEWGCTLRTVEIMTRVEPGKVSSLLADTPFEIASDRVAFRFMVSPGHSLAVHAGQMFDLMITVPVRYKGLFTETHIFMYCSDPMGICAGREVFGYTKKDAHYTFHEQADGSINGSVRRRGIALADFSFTPDPTARSSASSTATNCPPARSMSAACRIRSDWRRPMPISPIAARR
ncbi:acetoacetate decarboxylase family protein [Bradyrhizobium sp. 31Argb]|uniref:acetoacetate decarboxylase family protein n=1 Tax=Bradyrhizobium sp. 31Argb TaxID=3141247 RepID=UPI003747ED17